MIPQPQNGMYRHSHSGPTQDASRKRSRSPIIVPIRSMTTTTLQPINPSYSAQAANNNADIRGQPDLLQATARPRQRLQRPVSSSSSDDDTHVGPSDLIEDVHPRLRPSLPNAVDNDTLAQEEVEHEAEASDKIMKSPEVTAAPSPPSVVAPNNKHRDTTGCAVPMEIATKVPSAWIWCPHCKVSMGPSPLVQKAHMKRDDHLNGPPATGPARAAVGPDRYFPVPDYLEVRSAVPEHVRASVAAGAAASARFFDVFDLVKHYCRYCDVEVPVHQFKTHSDLAAHVLAVQTRKL